MILVKLGISFNSEESVILLCLLCNCVTQVQPYLTLGLKHGTLKGESHFLALSVTALQNDTVGNRECSKNY